MDKVDLKSLFNNLKLDKIELDTKLAQKYIDANEGIFRCLYFEPLKTIKLFDNYANVIACADSSELLLPDASTLTTTETWTVISGRLKRLATGIKRNSDLICQLEWIIRNIPPKNTQYSIELIVKNLLHASADWKAAYIEEGLITMADSTPMLILGFVAQIFKTCDNPIILSTPQTAVICHLFTQLCADAGWNVKLILIDQLDNFKDIEKNHKVYPNLFNQLLPKVTGIITEQSDLDSALDIFLNAGSHPMPLKHLVVQESVYEEFKKNIDWKCRLHHEKYQEEQEEEVLELGAKCSDLFRYKDKIFLFNCVEDHIISRDSKQVVIVESFRTVKELLSLIPKFKQLCVSIWASNVPEANEIALNIDVPIVWVNDYCNFTGSAEVTKPIYKRIDSVNMTVKNNSSIVKMMKTQEQWLKKTFIERCDAILNVIKSKDHSLGDKIEPEISNWQINNFINIDNGTIVLGFNIPDKVVLYNTFGTITVPSPGFDNIIRALINGSGVVIASIPKNEEEIFIAFEREGIPVVLVDDEDTKGLELKVPLGDSWCFQTKVIWTTFGTTFAN